jgi:hypothetical protein
MCREWDWSGHKKIAALKLGMNYQVCSIWALDIRCKMYCIRLAENGFDIWCLGVLEFELRNS